MMNDNRRGHVQKVVRYMIALATLVSLLVPATLAGCGGGREPEPTEPPVTLIRSATETPTPTATATPGTATPPAAQAATPEPTEPYPLPTPRPMPTVAYPYPTPGAP